MRIVCVSGSRADWNGLGMVAIALREAGHDVQIIATAQHAIGGAPAVKADGFNPITMHMPLGDTAAEVADTVARVLVGLDGLLTSQKPDLTILCGDRYETLASAFACAILGIPIAHIAGGDVTEGSLDNRFRDAITALADHHFPTNHRAAARLTNSLSVRFDRVHMVGSPALDRIRTTEIVSRGTFFNKNMSNGANINAKSILVSFHPSLDKDEPLEIIKALKIIDGKDNVNWILIGSNADAGAQRIDEILKAFAASSVNAARYVANLPPQQYYSALAHCDLLVGNSSAGIYEAPSFGIPVVNIGQRQSGRLSAANIRKCAANCDAIVHIAALQLAEGRKPCINPYGDGHSAPRIAEIIGWLSA